MESEIIKKYAAQSAAYPLPDEPDAGAMVNDPETGGLLVVGFKEHRQTYSKCGFIAPNASDELAASVCALFELAQDMPLIKTELLTEDDLLKHMGVSEPSDSLRRSATMALLGLKQSFASYLQTREK